MNISKMMFNLLDVKTKVYDTPFCAKTFGEMERMFKTTLSSGSKNSLICQYPKDFLVYHIGSYDEENGRINLLDNPVLLGTVYDMATDVNVVDDGVEFRELSDSERNFMNAG